MRVLIFGGGGMAQGFVSRLFRQGHTVYVAHEEECDVRRPADVAHHLGVVNPEWVIVTAGIDDEHDAFDTFFTNAYGSYVVAKACAKRDIPCILIASVAGLYGKPDHTAYCMSKAAVISLVQSLGFEHRIWAISPGRVDTPMREARYPNDSPGSRLTPDEVAFVVEDIMEGTYESGANVIIRIEGNDELGRKITVEDERNPWREELRVGQPVTV